MSETYAQKPKPSFISRLMHEIDAVIERDPAARNRWEVFFFYPSFHAMLFYRMAHFLYVKKWYFFARWLSQFARFFTGIEIHPGAVIGHGLFIDHAMGVVIGETAIIGDNVTLYHGVTLGGVSPSVDSAQQRSLKRHPTLENEVIIGSGAQILGPITVGFRARVGSNAVVLHNVPKGQTVVGIPAHPAKREFVKQMEASYGDGGAGDNPHQHFDAYGIALDVSMDCGPYDDQIVDLCKQVKKMGIEIEKLKAAQPAKDDK